MAPAATAREATNKVTAVSASPTRPQRRSNMRAMMNTLRAHQERRLCQPAKGAKSAKRWQGAPASRAKARHLVGQSQRPRQLVIANERRAIPVAPMNGSSRVGLGISLVLSSLVACSSPAPPPAAPKVAAAAPTSVPVKEAPVIKVRAGELVTYRGDKPLGELSCASQAPPHGDGLHHGV